MIRDDLRLDPPVHIPYGVEVFDKLTISPFEFFLAGSRYMGCAKPESDWDFITQDSPHVRAHLERLGFTDVLPDYAPRNGNTHAVYQVTDGSFRVHVGVCPSVFLQRTARDIVKNYMLEEHIKMPKAQRTVLWDSLYSILTTKAQPDFQGFNIDDVAFEASRL